MKTVTVELKNTKAFQLLKNLEELNVLTIKDEDDLWTLLKRTRSKSSSAPSLQKIKKMVDVVRAKRHGK